MNIYPNQLISTKEKLKIEANEKYPKFIRECAEYFSSQAIIDLHNLTEFRNLLNIAGSVINLNNYKYVENPYNTENSQKPKLPAKLRNYNIITPIIERYLGERRGQPVNTNVVAVGNDTFSSKTEFLDKQYDGALSQEFINMLNAMGIDTGVESKEVDFTKIAGETETNWIDTRAVQGQEIMEYIISAQDLVNKYQEAFFYWLVLGRVYTIKELHHNEIDIEVLNPLNVSIIGWSRNSRKAEDATAQIVRRKWTPNQIIERFGKSLSEDDIEWLQRKNSLTSTNQVVTTTGIYNSQFIHTAEGIYVSGTGNTLDVEYICWQSITKRGILTYMSEIGEKQKPVDETYVLNTAAGDISIEWFNENEWWYSYRISEDAFNHTVAPTSRIIYPEYGPGLVQRTQISNTSSNKLPVNGSYFGYQYHIIDSIVKRGIPYNELYNICHYRFELTLAKNKDKLLLFPLGLIPKTKGWNTERWMNSIQAFSIAFFDEKSEKAMQALQAIKELDMSLGKYMTEMWNFMNALKEEWWDVAGMNRQRYGDVNSSDGKGVNAQAIYQSSVSTQELVSQFESFRASDEQGLLDWSKFAYQDGKEVAYINNEGRTIYLNINGRSHAESEYSVFVNDRIDEYNKMKSVENMLLQPLAQNGDGKNSELIIGLVEANSMSKMKALAKKAEAIQRQFEQQMQESEQATQQHAEELNQMIEKMILDSKERIAKLNADTEIEKALIMADSFNAKEGDSDADGIPEAVEIEDRHFKRLLEMRKLNEQGRANRANEQLQAMKIKEAKRAKNS